VEVDLRITNQRGEVTTTGSARILLPVRGGGDPSLPVAPEVPASVLAAQERGRAS
jgi:hypothetical protein